MTKTKESWWVIPIKHPIIPIVIAGDAQGKLVYVGFEQEISGAKKFASRHAAYLSGTPSHPPHAVQQFHEYLAGQRKHFDIPLRPLGTPFQKNAWNILREIPYGQTRTYQEQAVKLGNTQLARAVGLANSKNPLAIVVPCHRVIGKTGQLTGFAGGLGTKRWLLDHEAKFC